MSEPLTVGQSVEYTVADRTLKLKPLALGRMKKAMLIFQEKGSDNLETIAKYLLTILDNGTNHDLTMEWILDNVTMPEAQKIMDDSRIINGLGSFFQTRTAEQPKTERPLDETIPLTPSV